MRIIAVLVFVGLACAAVTPARAVMPTLSPALQAQIAADTLTPKRFDIAAQPLRPALEEFARQSGVRVRVDNATVAGLESQGVSGTYTAAEALRRLIVATGMALEFSDASTAVVRDARELARETATLGPVRVVAPTSRSARYAAARSAAATKTNTPLRDVPQSVTVVTRELMRDQAMQSIADVVRYVPGIVMGQGEGNRDQPTIRGNATTADFFVDGVRDDVQYFRDLYNLERVEALKGSNAMLFGRGGGGGVINRVTKQPLWTPIRELTLQGGSFDNKRISADVGNSLASSIATRINGMYERSGVFRHGVTLTRHGVNPTVTFAPRSQATRLTLGYEHFADHRTADRGVPSFEGRPIDTDVATFFGDPAVSYSDARVHSAWATVAHESDRRVSLRNQTRLASYDKIYQNVFPGSVNAAGDEVSLSAYNNATERRNAFNQTDVTFDLTTGWLKHTVLAGAELGRQATENFRNTGYFNNTTTSVSAPVSSPTVSTPVTFRQSATDANNRVTNTTASVYTQNQMAVGSHLQLIAGVRYETFALRYHNNRTDSTLRRLDHMISPRAGAILKPIETLSLYGSYSVSHLPSAGDQFSSLSDVTKALEPERFRNYEIGAKWDIADRLALTTAVYRVDRNNTRAPDPTDPTRTVQTGSQRTKGFEVGLSGAVTSAWEIAAGYANQDALITSTTASAPTGARVPLVPHTTVSLWNRYQIAGSAGVALGVVHRADMYAAIDNRVTLPGFTEMDAAIYTKLSRRLRAQLNVENLFDTRYFVSANGNNNISPGSPRTLRLSLTTQF